MFSWSIPARNTKPILTQFSSPAVRIVVALTASLGWATHAAAQPTASNWPQRPVRIIVTTSAGASSDLLTRTVARRLAETWRVLVVVENVPGASGIMGLKRAATATPDGYTLVASGSNLALVSPSSSTDGIDPASALTAITQAVVNPIILVVRNDLGPKNFGEYVAHAKKRNGELLFGLTALQGLHHVVNEIIAQRTGTSYNYIPYKGGAPATADLLSGQIEAVLITLAAVTEHVRAKRLTAIAVTTKSRSTALPQVPTLDESGLPGFDIASWQGFLAPARTPRALIDKLYADTAAALRTPEVNRFLHDQGYNVRALPPAETDRLIRTEVAQFRKILQTAGLAAAR